MEKRTEIDAIIFVKCTKLPYGWDEVHFWEGKYGNSSAILTSLLIVFTKK